MSRKQEKWQPRAAIENLKLIRCGGSAPNLEVVIAARDKERSKMLKSFIEQTFPSPSTNVSECRDPWALLSTVYHLSRGKLSRWISSLISGEQYKEPQDGLIVIADAPQVMPEGDQELNTEEIFMNLMSYLRTQLDTVVPILIIHSDAHSVTTRGENKDGWESLQRTAGERGIFVILAGPDDGRNLQRNVFPSFREIYLDIFGRGGLDG